MFIDELSAKAIIAFLILGGGFIFVTLTAEALANIRQASELIQHTQKTITVTIKTGAK